MARTSYTQFILMVDFMEKNGDLSKPTGGARGRHWCNEKWKELAEKLNSEGSGKTAPEEKWRKVWSDLKNNIKRKWAKLKRSVQGTGGGPALKLPLTDLEHRVLSIMGEEAATGMPNVEELGFGEIMTAAASALGDVVARHTNTDTDLIGDEDWNLPTTSREQHNLTPPAPPPPLSPRATSVYLSLTPPTPPPRLETPRHTPPRPTANIIRTQRHKRRRQMTSVEEIFVRMENNAREDNKRRNRDFMELEREKIRLRESELQARRDELELRAQFLEFMKEALRVLERYLNE